MSFQLRTEETLRKNLRRIVRKQMDAVLEELTRQRKGPRDEAVHEARKSLKRIRAVLRLIRPEIGEKLYRRENSCFRDAARPLTEVRDARILVETLDKLVEHFQEHVSGRSFADVRKALQDHLRAVRKRVLDEQDAFVVVAETVRQARERVKGWTDVSDRLSSLGAGLRGVAGQARAAFRDAAAEPSVANLHEWRKQVKYLRYLIEALHPLWPERMEELAGETERMGNLLGDDHDLAVLRQVLTGDAQPVADECEREALLALIDRRRVEMVQEVLLLGDRFFRERPRELVRQLKGYWKAWRGRCRHAQPEETLPASV
jgi:CHAD domain-containing protein